MVLLICYYHTLLPTMGEKKLNGNTKYLGRVKEGQGGEHSDSTAVIGFVWSATGVNFVDQLQIRALELIETCS